MVNPDMAQAYTASHPALPVTKNERISGIDLARIMALLGMIIAHLYHQAPEVMIISPLANTVHGRAALTFVLIAGIGVTFLDRAKGPMGSLKTLLWRAPVLFLMGAALQPISTGPIIILQFYAVYYLIGWIAARLPSPLLAGIIPVWLGVGCYQWWQILPPLDISEDYTTLWRHGEIIFLTGQYPVITWGPIVLLGVLLGRLDWTDVHLVKVLTGCAASVVLTVHLGLAFIPLVQPHLIIPEWLLLEPHSHSITYLVEGYSAAVMVVGLCVLAYPRLQASRYKQLTDALVVAGRQSLTLYLTHLFWLFFYDVTFNTILDVSLTNTPLLGVASHRTIMKIVSLIDLASAFVIFALLVLQANLWHRYCSIGPFETILRPPRILSA